MAADAPDYGSFEIEGLRLEVPARELAVFNAGYERETRRLLFEYLKPGGVFVDVGAHVGVLSLLAARELGDGQVVAIEPSPESAATLRRNASANGIANVTLHTCAAGAVAGRTEFHVMDYSYLNGIGAHPLGRAVEVLEVGVQPLDELVSGPVDAIKVDCEGSEVDVLRGMERLVADSPEAALCVEWNPVGMRNAGADPLTLLDAIGDLGFEVFAVVDEWDRGTRREIEQVWAAVASGQVGDGWWANLFAKRRP